MHKRPLRNYFDGSSNAPARKRFYFCLMEFWKRVWIFKLINRLGTTQDGLLQNQAWVSTAAVLLPHIKKSFPLHTDCTNLELFLLPSVCVCVFVCVWCVSVCVCVCVCVCVAVLTTDKLAAKASKRPQSLQGSCWWKIWRLLDRKFHPKLCWEGSFAKWRYTGPD